MSEESDRINNEILDLGLDSLIEVCVGVMSELASTLDADRFTRLFARLQEEDPEAFDEFLARFGQRSAEEAAQQDEEDSI
jgi:hypothetical protein